MVGPITPYRQGMPLLGTSDRKMKKMHKVQILHGGPFSCTRLFPDVPPAMTYNKVK